MLESHARFLAPALFDDRLLVNARCLDVRGARFRFEYAITRDGVHDRRRLDDGTARSTRRRCGRRGSRAWLVDAIATAEALRSPSA